MVLLGLRRRRICGVHCGRLAVARACGSGLQLLLGGVLLLQQGLRLRLQPVVARDHLFQLGRQLQFGLLRGGQFNAVAAGSVRSDRCLGGCFGAFLLGLVRPLRSCSALCVCSRELLLQFSDGVAPFGLPFPSCCGVALRRSLGSSAALRGLLVLRKLVVRKFKGLCLRLQPVVARDHVLYLRNQVRLFSSPAGGVAVTRRGRRSGAPRITLLFQLFDRLLQLCHIWGRWLCTCFVLRLQLFVPPDDLLQLCHQLLVLRFQLLGTTAIAARTRRSCCSIGRFGFSQLNFEDFYLAGLEGDVVFELLAVEIASGASGSSARFHRRCCRARAAAGCSGHRACGFSRLFGHFGRFVGERGKHEGR